jgi:hypothetical protein
MVMSVLSIWCHHPSGMNTASPACIAGCDAGVEGGLGMSCIVSMTSLQSKWCLDTRRAPTVHNTTFHRKVSHLQLGCQLASQRLCISRVPYKVWRRKVHAAVVCRLDCNRHFTNHTLHLELCCVLRIVSFR